ncbi:hypothetical protein HDU67_006351 [Dinochytrium kinnereticum]|nr:hypothetical protein HDU67_006351 [Dinochytrium kinnereticum]
MSLSKILRSDYFQEKWDRFRQLSAASDPKETPFKSKYEARDILEMLRKDILEIKDEDESSTTEKKRVIAVIDYYRGCEELRKPTKSLKHRKAIQYFEDAGAVYSEFKKQSTLPPASDIIAHYGADLLGSNADGKCLEGDRWEALEGLHTHSTYYLAQVCGALKLQDKSWALDCMTLSQYYSQNNAFALAYECLTSSEYILSLAKVEIVTVEEIQDAGDTDPFARANADIAWIWGKYYLLALTISAERKDIELNIDIASSCARKPDIFKELNAPAKRPQIPPNFARSYDEDLSQIYSKFTAFEKDPNKKLKLLKRRAEFLKGIVLSRLSLQHYLPLVQQITYELATVHESIRDFSDEEFRSSSLVGSQKLALGKEVNEATDEAIRLYEEFLKLFSNPITGRIPSPFSDPDDSRTYMTAKLRKAWLWSQRIPLPLALDSVATAIELKEQKSFNLKKSLEDYSDILTYYNNYGIPE